MGNRGTGHAPVPDPTNSYCTVDGCLRFLNRLDPTEHRRGAGGRRRHGDGSRPMSPQTPIADVMPLIARVDERLGQASNTTDRLASFIEGALLSIMERLDGNRPADPNPALADLVTELRRLRGDIRTLTSRVDKLAVARSQKIVHRRIADGGIGGNRERRRQQRQEAAAGPEGPAT